MISERVDPCPPDPRTIDRLLGGAHHDPHSVLGAHPHRDGTVVRVLRPHADEVHVVREGGEGQPLVRVHDSGLFSGVVPGPPADYRLAVRYGERVDIVDDPYRWLPTLGEVDLHLIGEGRHERLWDVLGAHVRRYDTPAGSVTGTSFAVWAPTAQGVRVTGDFDGWSGWAHPMRVLGSSGVWELFVPGIEPGTRYKFRILGRDGRWRDKADPMAFRTEIPPATASIVDASGHTWGDEEWMQARALRQAHAEPMSVYEVHLGSWRPGLDYRELAREMATYLGEMGFTHVELLPVAEHPFGGSWGYQVTSFYAPTARFGTPDDFRWFVDHLHQHGFGVIIDWVPGHFPRDEWALAKFDGSALYEHADPRRGEQPDWGTLVFDFGRREVRNFLVANALFWLDQFHVDGLRVDAVASMLYLDYSRPEGQWLPNVHGGRENLDAVAFLQEMNATVYRNHPGVVTIAEESTAWPGVTRPTHLGGLGFGFKWNMGWMHDTLDYAGRDPVYRGYHHNQMTFSLMYAFSENFVLPLSHDEVVHGKGSLWARMPGDAWNKSANLRALLAYMWAHPGKQLLFQGGEFGQEREWSESRSIDWHLLEDPLHAGVKTLVGDLNRAYRATPALWTRDSTPEGFSWIDANDASGNVLSFLRHGVDADGRPTVLACVANFSGSPKQDYRVGLPFAGRWREVLNTDAQIYGGSGVGNLGAVEAEQVMWHGRPASAVLQLPPAGVLWLVPEPGAGPVRRHAGATTAATAATTNAAAAAATPSRGIAAVPVGAVADEPDLAAEVPASDAPERHPDTPASDVTSTGSADLGDEPDLAAEVPVSDAPARPAAVAGPAATTTGTSAPVTRSATGGATGSAPAGEDPAPDAAGTPWTTPAPRPTPRARTGDDPARAATDAAPVTPRPADRPDTAEPAGAGWTIATPAEATGPAADADEPGPSAAATGLPTASGERGSAPGAEQPPVDAAGDLATTDAVPDPPAAGTDSVLDDGPAAPVSDDAPAEAPPEPGPRA
ncbi:1,4-alpha-glucan branching enzyme [Pseudonocardia kunmingensis]|uniref:1,4-alpha-glucan branching enzyme GlgB n=1 Tax=Pseudonocardia kunmingensis TaxID=630975 RepID=A0A543E014_9PSEU|nr:1,4-alpha-glucan branching enzyme [Pseudonocardia kunmingensis]